MARAGMAYILSDLRRMVDDAGTAVWSDDDLQAVLDDCRTDFWELELRPAPRPWGGSEIWTVYVAGYTWLEGAESGTAAWRVYDANGSAIGTASYTADYRVGVITFLSDQRGSARYLDGRSYDVNRAAALLWEQRAGMYHDEFDFDADGSKFVRSQKVQHCLRMADYYRRRSRPRVAAIRRVDTA